ncbi:ATP-binding protein [Streptomyces apocyni]|uniref:ATP-binding protein n=1 Tax=Streptomyces apocyni TaxID=2654677 RepID=UPI0012EA3961|nr:ATP-binding protein [Streptomyces apocyni]
MKIERQEVVWATALRALDAQHRTTTWLRMACVATLWMVALRCDPQDQGQVFLQLLPVTAGSVLSHVHARPALLDHLASLPALDRVTAHLEGTRGRATVDLPGVLEGGGILVASTLYGGWWAVTGFSPQELIIALVAVTVFTWSVFLNVVLDPGYYAPYKEITFGIEQSAGPPSPVLNWLRHAVPPGVALLVALMFLPAWTPSLAAVPFAVRVVLVLSILSLRLAWLGFDQVLAASAETVADAEQAARVQEAGELHSVGKNAVGSILNALESPHYKHNEVRSLLRNTLVELEETIRTSRGTALVPLGASSPLGELWDAAVAILPLEWRLRCTLNPEAHSLILGDADRQLVRRVISDLVTNALKAGARQVACTVRYRHDDPSTIKVEVLVHDDGRGMPSDVLDNATTSLSVMAKELRRYGGDLTFTTPGQDGAGTLVRACWRSATPAPSVPVPRSGDAPVAALQKES